ncbi:MAG: Eco57I restriction-modification methylase domain-containing protein [Candidatus Lokiarchaeota archaeon]|nr:Eco57I restriction-modification methylase domain-containing protein [Candidatus Lokiarchaeota archaeon]
MAFLQVPRDGLPPVIPTGFIKDLHERFRNGGLSPIPTFYRVLCTIWFSYLHSDHPRTDSDGVFKVVPFLGGNVFQPIPAVEVDQNGGFLDEIEIDDGVMGSILAMVDQHEWQIAEANPNKANSGITPAILGYIFEMRCNRKESGTYYTPGFITDYITRKAVSIYATRMINEHFHTGYEDFISELIFKENKTHEEIIQVEWFYFNVLGSITVCDPACGSGAFLVEAVRVLADVQAACIGCLSPGDARFRRFPALPRPGSTTYDIKRHVATSNVFGVDVQPGSVEVAKLRLSLSLVSALDLCRGDILPALDEGLKTGNSLLGFITPSDGSPNKLAIHGARLEEAFRRARGPLPGRAEAIADLDGSFLSSLGGSHEAGGVQPFHWGVEYSEVFKRGGFDIIIGNPPYLSFSSSKAKKGIIGKEIIRRVYKNTDDIYEAFVLRAMQLCRGLSGMIMPYSFYRQIGARMTRHLLAYDNLGEGIFVGVSIAVAVAFFDTRSHEGFEFRNYTFLPDKAALIGRIPAERVSSFDLFKDDPVIKSIERVARTHDSYGLEVTRGEELGKKALSTERREGQVPIYTASEMSPFKLLPPAYFLDRASIKKKFYCNCKIGANLAFRGRIKAAYVGDVFTIKSIICIYHGSPDTLIEVLGTWNSKLFDWYHDKRFSGFQEIRLNTIADIENRYPLLLPGRDEFRHIVRYLTVQYHPYLHRIVDFIIYEAFFHERLVSDGAHPAGRFALVDAIRPHLVPVEYDEWSRLHWKSMRGEGLEHAEGRELARLEAQIKDAIGITVAGMEADGAVQHIVEAMRAHPWIDRIETESLGR